MLRSPISVILLLSSMIACQGEADAPERAPDRVPNADEMSAAILALSDRSGPEVDEIRKTLPVPLIAVDLAASGELPADVVVRHATSPGRPASMAGRDDFAQAPSSTPDPEAAPPRGAFKVFGNDERFIFFDFNYPFSTVGRIDSPRGSCTGTMIGPRHALTASHCILWNGDGTTGWVQFRPALNGTQEPFDEAWASQVYFYRKVDEDQDSSIFDDEIAFDFVVLVLDRRKGDETGWMGSKTYTTDWDGDGYWANIGYPADLGGATEPVFQDLCAVTSTAEHCWSDWCSILLKTLCDTFGGQSGGPLYGTWDGIPHVVGTVSAENDVTNKFAGGELIPTLINQARNDAP